MTDVIPIFQEKPVTEPPDHYDPNWIENYDLHPEVGGYTRYELEIMDLKYREMKRLAAGMHKREMEGKSREVLRDARRIQERARLWMRRKEPIFEDPHRLPTFDPTKYLVPAAAAAAAISIALWKGHKDPWIKPPTEYMPFIDSATTLLWDAFEYRPGQPNCFEIISKPPSVDVFIEPGGGLDYTQCLHIHWNKHDVSSWRTVTLRWYHLIPIRNRLYYGFLHRGGPDAVPQFLRAVGNIGWGNQIVRSGFYSSYYTQFWPIWILSTPRDIRWPLGYGVRGVPGYWTANAWTTLFDREQYLTMTSNSTAIDALGMPIKYYPHKLPTLPYFEITVMHGAREVCDYYLDNITILTAGGLLQDIFLERLRRARQWPLEQIPDVPVVATT